MSFWKKFKKGFKMGLNIGRDALSLMSVLPGPVGDVAKIAAPISNIPASLGNKYL